MTKPNIMMMFNTVIIPMIASNKDMYCVHNTEPRTVHCTVHTGLQVYKKHSLLVAIPWTVSSNTIIPYI